MNKTKNVVLGLAALTLVIGASVIFTNQASAYKGDPAVKGPNYSVERHTLMEKAFETKNYESWKSLMGNQGRVTTVINKDNFAKFAEAHKLAENGDLAGAQKIRQELGLGQKNGQGSIMGNPQGRGNGRHNSTNK
jgi:hypothetical protein